LSYSSSPFCFGYFGDVVLQTICSGWLQILILLLSAPQEARITGMNHQCPDNTFLYYGKILDIYHS
jgi:hypothetical protein